jgi:hypothetical protein
MHPVVSVRRVRLFISHFFDESGKRRAGNVICIQLAYFGFEFLLLFHHVFSLTN